MKGAKVNDIEKLRKYLRKVILNQYGSINKFCLVTGYSRSQLSAFLNGRRSPSIDYLYRLLSDLDDLDLYVK